MGRIKEITSDETFAFDEDALNDFINVLNEYKESTKEKSVADLTDDDMRLLVQKLKEKKSNE